MSVRCAATDEEDLTADEYDRLIAELDSKRKTPAQSNCSSWKRQYPIQYQQEQPRYIPVRLSCFLQRPNRGFVCKHPLILCLQPRPCFSHLLHDALTSHALNPSKNLYRALHFPLHAVNAVQNVTNRFGVILSIPSDLIQSVLLRLRSSTVAVKTVVDVLKHTIWPHLHSFQRNGVLRGIVRHAGRTLLADDMGLGKTLQGLAMAEFYRKTILASVLIICPATLRSSWFEAVSRWLNIPVHNIHAPKDAVQVKSMFSAPSRDVWDSPMSASYVIVTYDALHRLTLPCFDIVLADECHVLRNVNSQRSRAALLLLQSAKKIILISGTPALSRPSELYTLLTALYHAPDAPFISYNQFRERYCGGLDNCLTRSVTNADELHAILDLVMIRRTKSEVVHDLPPKRRRLVTVELSSTSAKDLKVLRNELDQIEEALQQDSEEKQQLLLRKQMLTSKLFHRTAWFKLPGIITRLTQLFRDSGRPKLLVFAQHLVILDAVERLARREQVSWVRIDGKTNHKERGKLVHDFQKDEHIRVALLSLAVAGTGLTLTAADIVFFSELNWVPSVLEQAEDRAHRLGRKSEVIVEYVVAPGSVDDMMWSTVHSKLGFVSRTVDGSHPKRRKTFAIHEAGGIHLSNADIQTAVVESVMHILENEPVQM
ncbi:SWI/SNF-related matrix-associated actin-dependent regulator of chromatin subfamily A-like protein 1 [Gracilariopsis chorda]|uniref:SWI/SNF-related matrix-associated actin-dependent regulator of chromatin subfamily A-like protein 1 n=1 Tax=Gracilariopsis chorda TaxID=448386 RepID=A0A2V3ILL8_9FLOR|nr:SWI/SNF-related matrix-associated actin-dependent regulator of chromatin subfamily A-like protein 1 [Gracilariopsis chorda]|eukprot:PXF42984.1 SWI/SNF-related matrix-associated actin-dependent regulator of chromatin subfamily A-like protein 1 [Gracilariopsis chorda]